MSINNHLTTEQVLDYLEGRLDAAGQKEVLDHLSGGCRDCARKMKDLTRMTQAFQAASWPAPSERARRRAVNSFDIYQSRKRAQQPTTFLRPALIGLALIAAIFVIIILNRPQPAYAAVVQEMTGNVDMKANAGASWQALSPGQSIPVGSIIRTSSNGKAVLTFPGGARAALGPDTQLELSGLAPTHGQWQITLAQKSGKMDVVTGGKTALLRVQTDAGTADSTEATFGSQVEEDGTTVVDVEEGSVRVDSPAGSSVISSGNTGVLQKNKARTTPKAVPSSTATPEERHQEEQNLHETPTSSSNQHETTEPNGLESTTVPEPTSSGND